MNDPCDLGINYVVRAIGIIEFINELSISLMLPFGNSFEYNRFEWHRSNLLKAKSFFEASNEVIPENWSNSIEKAFQFVDEFVEIFADANACESEIDLKHQLLVSEIWDFFGRDGVLDVPDQEHIDTINKVQPDQSEELPEPTLTENQKSETLSQSISPDYSYIGTSSNAMESEDQYLPPTRSFSQSTNPGMKEFLSNFILSPSLNTFTKLAFPSRCSNYAYTKSIKRQFGRTLKLKELIIIYRPHYISSFMINNFKRHHELLVQATDIESNLLKVNKF